jgi:hypothetical protein
LNSNSEEEVSNAPKLNLSTKQKKKKQKAVHNYNENFGENGTGGGVKSFFS